MALADFDQTAPPGYVYTGQYEPSGALSTRYVGNGVLPAGMNTGAFNPDGSLRWASNAMGGGPAVRPMAPVAVSPPITYQPPTGRFNLNAMFSGPTTATATRPALFSTTKSAPVQGGVDAAMKTRTANAGAEEKSLVDFAKELLRTQPQVDQYGEQEVNAVGRLYGSGSGSIEAQLADLNRREQAAANIAAQNAASRARRGINARRVGGGSSSYLDRLLSEQLYGIGAGAAGRAAQQGRSDLSWLTGQRTGAIGQRQSILDALAQRRLAPVLAGQQVEAGGLANLGRVADLEYGNNVYERPEDEWRRRLEFMDYLGQYGA